MPCAQARNIARPFLRAHRAVYAFDRGEGALYGAQCIRARNANLDQRAEQRPRAPNAA